MNNFIPVTVYPLYNGWTHPAENYHVQQMRETMYSYSTREEVFNPERADEIRMIMDQALNFTGGQLLAFAV
ncbi:hypothetical protein [Brevibacillus laterosporus]|uniref:hypothetical protein n=1 Tax=Brevibacillus laterosporus TaxID=1465 RepID=UPI003D25A24E